MPLLNKWDYTVASTHISSMQHNLALFITEVHTHTYTCSLSSGDNQCKTSTGSVHVNINILILISPCHYPTIMRWCSQKWSIKSKWCKKKAHKLDPFKTVSIWWEEYDSRIVEHVKSLKLVMVHNFMSPHNMLLKL